MKGQSVARTRLRLNPSRVKIPLGKEEFQCMKFSPYQAPSNCQGKDGGVQSADNRRRRARFG